MLASSKHLNRQLGLMRRQLCKLLAHKKSAFSPVKSVGGL